ncbi:hypothetical protein RUND412_006376 [Rhizina undulata]
MRAQSKLSSNSWPLCKEIACLAQLCRNREYLRYPWKIDDSGRMIQGTTEIALEIVYNWLGREGNKGWLLLIDNKDTPEVGDLNKLLPTCNWGTVIITSRLSSLHRYGKCIEIEGLGEGAGLELILKSSGISQKNLAESELAEAKGIVAALGELPLALDQAAAYIRARHISFSAYRKKLNELAMSITFGTNSLSLAYRPTRLPFIRPGSFHFGSCVMMHRSFYRYEDRLEKAMGDFFTFSLVKRKDSEDSFWIHPLVHTWTRERVNSIPERRQNAENAIALVTSTIVTNENKRSPADWIFARRILSHIHRLYIGSAYKKLGLYSQAEVSYGNALAGYEKEFGSDHHSTLTTAHNLASIFDDQRRYNEAFEMYQRVLAGYEKALGSDHPSTLTTVYNMGTVFNSQGRYNEALEMYQRALAGQEKALGSDHPHTLTTVHNMASIFDDLGRYNEALEMYQRVLAGEEKALGSDHPSTLTTVPNMASVFGKKGRYSEALEMYRRALAGREKALGSDHPGTLTTVHNMVAAFHHQERYDDALQWFQRALTGREKSLGKDHPYTLSTARWIAIVTAGQKKGKLKKRLKQKYLSIQNENFEKYQ